MAQTTLTIFAGDQLYKSVGFPPFFTFLDHILEQLLCPVDWDVYWSYPWASGLVYR